MKKMLTAMLSLALVGAMAIPALAAAVEPPVIAPAPDAGGPGGYTIQLNGEDAGARARVIVPLRAVAEKLGFTVTWDNGTVTVTGPEQYAELTIGVDQYFAAPTREGMAGASLFSLGCAPVLLDDVTYVPVELFDALLGCREGTVTLEGDTVKLNIDPGAVQIPSPFTDCDTLEEAAKAAGFTLTVPEQVSGSPRRGIQAMGTEMIQVFYGTGETEICVRKAPGSGDISGDYTAYAQTEDVDVNGRSVTLKGESGQAYLALWLDGGYACSILARGGMSRAEMIALVQLVK